MTRLLISTAVAGLLALSGAALAQSDDHRDRGAGHDKAAPQAAHPAPQAAPQAAPAGRSDNRGHMDQRPSAGAQAAPAAAPASRAGMRGHGPSNTPGPAPSNAMRGPDNRSAAPNTAARGADNRRTAPGNRGARPDFSSYHRNFSAPHHFRAPAAYRRPNGWYAQRWTFGQILPALFWAPDYWLNDYNDYGLMPPPPGTVWVRDNDDALLIDQQSGEIIQVEYSVFY